MSGFGYAQPDIISHQLKQKALRFCSAFFMIKLNVHTFKS